MRGDNFTRRPQNEALKSPSRLGLMDLHKYFDTHDLLIAKINANGFDLKALKLLHSCLTRKEQK